MHDLHDCGHLLAKTLKTHRYMMRRRFDEMGLHRGQPPLIMELYKHDGITHSELSERLEVTPATVTNLVKRMERDGFVIRRREDKDERISRVYLTEEGKAIRAKIIANIRDIESKTFKDFSEEDMNLLQGFMERIIGNLKKMW